MCSVAKRITRVLNYSVAVWLLIPFVANAEFSGTLNFATNYTWRGYSKSDGDPVVQANLDFEHESGLYLGTWASMVDFADNGFKDRSRVEVIPYLGWTYKLSDDWRADVQWSRYLYDGKIFNNSSDYNEFYFLLHYRDLVTTNVSISEDAYNSNEIATNYEINGRYPITDALQLSGTLGYFMADNALEYDYLYWDFGFTWFYKLGSLDFRYVHAREAGQENLSSELDFELLDPNPTFVFSMTVGF